MNHRNISKNKLIFGGLILVIVFVFLYFKIVPGGEITYQRSWPRGLASGKGFIYNFTPVDRVSGENDNKIVGDPVYFSLFTPRPFSKAKITIIYSDHLSEKTPIVELGVLVDKLVWQYDLRPVDNKILDRLAKQWVSIEKNGVMFLQKNLIYNSLDLFQQDLRTQKLKGCQSVGTCLAVYNYPVEVNGVKKVHKIDSSINIPLRGSHQFYLYVIGGKLKIETVFADLNQDKDSDPITINVYRNNKLIKQERLVDKNNSNTGKVEVKKLNLEADNLPEGIYKVQIKINNDVVIKKIKTSGYQMSFVNRLWPVSYPHPITFYTDSNYLQTKILNPASRQTIQFGKEKFAIKDIYQQKTFYSTQEYNKIVLNKDDIIIENNGVFSLHRDSLLDPNIKRVDQHLNTKAIKYIIAKYSSPHSLDNGDISATIEVDLQHAYREQGKYSFIISIPGLRADDGQEDYIKIKKIVVELKGRTWWQKLKSLF